MLQREEAKKQETNTSTPTIASSPWLSSSSRSKADHRIVRVSRAFGGKDRHSKVCTVRGLRDRRVRLSVPTAIQLYDLQDRLGLSQPSKVVDWLLEAAKHEIEELPPLQFPPSMMMGLINNSNADESNVPPPFESLISSSWDHQSQPSISLGLNDQTNLDLHNFGLLLSSSSTTSNQVLDYQQYQHQHHQAEISNSTQPYFPYTYNRH